MLALVETGHRSRLAFQFTDRLPDPGKLEITGLDCLPLVSKALVLADSPAVLRRLFSPALKVTLLTDDIPGQPLKLLLFTIQRIPLLPQPAQPLFLLPDQDFQTRTLRLRLNHGRLKDRFLLKLITLGANSSLEL